jgi:hypothetical protein
MFLPQSNARLTSIHVAGASEDYDLSEGQGAVKWTGDEDAYVIERVTTTFAAQGALQKIRDINVIIPDSLLDVDGDPLVVKTGDIVSYKFEGGNHTRRVLEYTHAYLPGVSKYMRLHLELNNLESG